MNRFCDCSPSLVGIPLPPAHFLITRARALGVRRMLISVTVLAVFAMSFSSFAFLPDLSRARRHAAPVFIQSRNSRGMSSAAAAAATPLLVLQIEESHSHFGPASLTLPGRDPARARTVSYMD